MRRGEREKQSKKPRNLNQEALRLFLKGKLTVEKGRNAGKVSAYKIMDNLKISQAVTYKLEHFLENLQMEY